MTACLHENNTEEKLNTTFDLFLIVRNVYDIHSSSKKLFLKSLFQRRQLIWYNTSFKKAPYTNKK